MRIVILGASGRIGSLALREALGAGHVVSILARTPAANDATKGVRAVTGSITDPDAVREVLAGAEAVIAAVGPRTNTPTDEAALVQGMQVLVEAMGTLGVGRLVALSGAAVDVPGDRKPLVDRLASRLVRLAARHVVGAKQREFEVFSASDLSWTALRPPLVRDGQPTGYRLSDTLRPGARITRSDVARALVDQAEDETFVRGAPFVLPR